MRRLLITIACAGLLWQAGAAQEAPTKPSPKSTTVIGCLAGPDADDLYTLTNMQHRTGVMVVGGEELKKGAGAKVKLTGAWETSAGSERRQGRCGAAISCHRNNGSGREVPGASAGHAREQEETAAQKK